MNAEDFLFLVMFGLGSNGYCVITIVSFLPFAAWRPELQRFSRIWEYVPFDISVFVANIISA